MKERLEQIKAEAIRQINESEALDRLNDVRVNFLGKKGELTAVLKGMKDVAPEERPKIGQLVMMRGKRSRGCSTRQGQAWSADSVRRR